MTQCLQTWTCFTCIQVVFLVVELACCAARPEGVERTTISVSAKNKHFSSNSMLIAHVALCCTQAISRKGTDAKEHSGRKGAKQQGPLPDCQLQFTLLHCR